MMKYPYSSRKGTKKSPMRTLKQKRKLICSVYMMWHDSLPQTMDGETARAAIRREIEMLNDPNATYIGINPVSAAIELGRMPIEDFVAQWNWLNDNQPSDYAEAKCLFAPGEQ